MKTCFLSILLLLATLTQAQSWYGCTTDGDSLIVNLTEVSLAYTKGAGCVMVHDGFENIPIDQPIDSVVAHSCGDIFTLTSSRNQGSLREGTEFAINRLFIRKIKPLANGSKILTINPKINFNVDEDYDDVMIIMESCGSGTGVPTGSAGGDLTGTYPNPTVGTGKITSAKVLNETLTTDDLDTGSVNTLEIVDGGVAYVDLSQAVKDSISASGPDNTWSNSDNTSDADHIQDIAGFDLAITGAEDLTITATDTIATTAHRIRTVGTGQVYLNSLGTTGGALIELYSAGQINLKSSSMDDGINNSLVYLTSGAQQTIAATPYAFVPGGLSAGNDGDLLKYDHGTTSIIPTAALDTTSLSNRIDAKLSLPALTTGSVLFSNGTTLAQDNANFFWDDSANKLFIGGASNARLSVLGNSLGVTQDSTAGFILSNYTPATVGAQQISPMFIQGGSGWGTTGSAAQTVRFGWDVLPVQGTAPTGTYRLSSSINNAAFTERLTVGSDGLTTAAFFAASGGNQNISSFSASGTITNVSSHVTYNNSRGYAPTSGTGTYAGYSYTGTINQTGGANGKTRGLYINPTLTAAADFMAIDVARGRSIFAGRVEFGKGADVASANDLTLGADGNLFHITGTTQINAIITAAWQAGSEITLIFDSTPTVKNATSGGAGTSPILLLGAADFVASANDVLRLVFDGTSWFEISRSVN